MKQDEIIDMAIQAGINNSTNGLFFQCDKHDLNLFAKLVAAAEREACAELEKNLALSPAMFLTMAEYQAYRHGVLSYREAIRARGEA